VKSILVAVLCCIASFLGIEYVFEHVYSFEVWIGTPYPLLPLLHLAELHDADYAAILASLFFTFAVVGLLAAHRDRFDRAIIAEPEGPPVDGELVAITGNVEALGQPLVAPFSGQTCLAYDYVIEHRNSLSESDGGVVVDREGLALAPCAIRSGVRLITLLGWPGLESFPTSVPDRARAERFVVSTKFEKRGDLDALLQWGEVGRVLDAHGGAVRKDWSHTFYDVGNHTASFTERILPPGEEVTVIGRYSASKNALLPEPHMSAIRMFPGTKRRALAAVLESRKGNMIGAGCLFVVSVLIAAGFVLYQRF
jgi:hypothetical protein